MGVNLDNEAKSAQATLQSAKKVTWPQIFDPGTVEKRGLDGRLANELGIFTLPTMFLVDANGKVVSRNLQAAELDSEIEKLVKSSAGVATRPALPKFTPNNNPATTPKKKP